MKALGINLIHHWHRLGLAMAGRGVFVGLLLAGVVAAVSAADTAVPGSHTFTDDQGRSLVASIARVDDPDVYLQGGSGDPFKVKMNVFIASDQAYIRQWALAHGIAPGLFEFTVARVRVTKPTATLEHQGFTVKVKNLQAANYANLRVEYVLLRQISSDPTVARPRVTGAAKITSLSQNGEFSFDTAQMATNISHLAVWVRVYSPSGAILQEWTSDPEMTKTEEWTTTAKPAPAKPADSGPSPTDAPSDDIVF